MYKEGTSLDENDAVMGQIFKSYQCEEIGPLRGRMGCLKDMRPTRVDRVLKHILAVQSKGMSNQQPGGPTITQQDTWVDCEVIAG
jgi:hypothetical protein